MNHAIRRELGGYFAFHVLQQGIEKPSPNPPLDGEDTAGPPNSAQRRCRLSSSTDHVTETYPPSFERAPYLFALVQSSWSTSAITCARVGPSMTLGPAVLTACRKGMSSSSRSSANPTLCWGDLVRRLSASAMHF